MDKIYVISPYAGDVKRNVDNAIRYCKFVMSKGYMPLASHLYFTQLTDDNVPAERRLGLNMGLELLEMCDEAWVFYEDRISSGMTGEINKSKELGIVIRYFMCRNGQIVGEFIKPALAV